MNKLRLLSIVLAGCLAGAAQVWGAPTGCPQLFAGGVAPDFINQKLANGTQELCYPEFALMHSSLSKTPLYGAERLTRHSLRQARQTERTNNFHPEPRLRVGQRAELRHYQRSGYDRGHVVPAADVVRKQDSFTLANMVPQVPENNRGIWAEVEDAVRKLSASRGELYVVTGPLFAADRLKRIGGAVVVPTHLYKAVYDPQRREGAAYVVENSAAGVVQTVSLPELEKISGLKLFPAAGAVAEMPLPDPAAPRYAAQRARRRH